MIFQSVFLVSLFILLKGAKSEPGKCHPPHLDNGIVEAEEGAGGTFFKAEFRCNPGFTLSGSSTLKCRMGIWSGTLPVCSVTGCDPIDLPPFVNGRRLKVKGTRDSVFKYRCNKGYRLFGPKNVYCTKNGWKLDEIPVCARFGCDVSTLLGDGVPHGRYRSMFQGAAYRFHCESGSMMVGSSAVYCDGYSWNGTKPECLVPPTTPLLAVEVDGAEVMQPVATVGQRVKLVCKAQGGNPFPELSFMLNGKRVEADNKEMIYQGYDAVHTFVVEDHHAGLDMSCIAENRMTSLPVGSSHQTLIVKFGPSNSYIHGDELLIPNTEASFTCTSDESDPTSEMSVEILDQDENDITSEVTKLPNMKGSAGFASAIQFKFHVLPHYKSVFIKCVADNGESQASSSRRIAVINPPEVSLEGPSHFGAQTPQIYTCSTKSPNTEVSWHITDQNNQNVEYMIVSEESSKEKTISITEVTAQEIHEEIKVKCKATNNIGEDHSEIIAIIDYAPKWVSLSGLVTSGPKEIWMCESPKSQPIQELRWEITDLRGEPMDFVTHKQSEEDEAVVSTVSIETDPHTSAKAHTMNVKCIAENDVGYVEDVSTGRLTYAPSMITIKGPTSAKLNEEIVFICSTDASYPAVTLRWLLDNQDMTIDASQSDTSDEEGVTRSVSTLRLWPEMGGHQHLLECRAEGTSAGNKTSFMVEGDYEYEEESYNTEDQYEEHDTGYEYTYEDQPENEYSSEDYKVSDYDGEEANYHGGLESKSDGIIILHSEEQDDKLMQQKISEEDYEITNQEVATNFEATDVHLHPMEEQSEDSVLAESENDYSGETDQNDAVNFRSSDADFQQSKDQRVDFMAAEPDEDVLAHDSDANEKVSAEYAHPKQLLSSGKSKLGSSFNIVIIFTLLKLACW